MKEASKRAKSPHRKKLRGGQVVVPVNPLETHIYVNFVITGSTITSVTTTDGRVTAGTAGSGTLQLNLNPSGSTSAIAPALTTLKDFTVFGYRSTTPARWTEISRAQLDMGGTTVGLYGTERAKPIRKQQGPQGKLSEGEIPVPADVNTFGGVLNFTNLGQTIFGFSASLNPNTATNVYIQLVFTSNYPTPNTKWSGWNPATVTGLSLWLDAVEPGPNGFSPNTGIPLPNWQDKSGKNNHAFTQTSSAPIYQTNTGTTGTYKMGLYFNGSTNFFSGPMQNNPKYCCMFAVVGPDDYQGDSRVLSLGAPGINDLTGTNTYASMTLNTWNNTTQYTTRNSGESAASYYADSIGNKLSIATSWINSASANVLLNGIIRARFTGSIATAALNFTSTLTVTAVETGPIAIGMILSGTGIPLNTMVVAFGTGTGDIGTYTVTIHNQVNSSPTSIASTTITGVSTMPINKQTNTNLNITSYCIGRNLSGGSFFKGYIHEILVYTQPLSKQTRQTIEGYLAGKWGIPLNAAHLYGSTRQPNIETNHKPFPLALNNIQPLVWLDGQDPLGNESSSFPLISTDVTTWTDKSGNNNHGTSVRPFAPTFLGNGVVFNGTATYSLNGSRVLKYPRITYATITGGSVNQDNISGIAFNSSGIGYATSYIAGTFSSISPEGNVSQVTNSVSYPTGIVVDSKGNVYVTCRNDHTIRRYDILTGSLSVIAGSSPNGVSVEPWVARFAGSVNNNLLTVTSVTSGVIAIGATLTTGGKIISYGTGTGSTGTYNLSDAQYNYSSSTFVSFRLGGKVLGAAAKFYLPYGITIDKNDIIYVTDCNHMIRRIEFTGPTGSDPNNSSNWSVSGVAGGWNDVTNTYSNFLTSDIRDGSCDIALFKFPYGIAVDPTGRYLYVVDKGTACIRKIDTVSRMVTTCQNTRGNLPADPTAPYCIACDQYGILYISCYTKEIYMYNTEQQMAPTVFVNPASATGLAVYNNRLYYYVDGNPNNIIYSVTIPRPTYLYSPILTPLTNNVHAFVVSNASGYNRNVSSILSLSSGVGVETYTDTVLPSQPPIMEDSTKSSHISLYNDNGNRNVYRNNIRVQTGVTDAPGHTASMPPSLIYFNSNNTTVAIRRNGGAFVSGTGTFGTLNIGAFGLGLQPANIRRLAKFITTNSGALMNYSFDGTIYEVIVYTENLTQTHYQFLEAYLCWKWSIPLLDTTNPYYTSNTTPPNPPIVFTTQIPTPIDKITFKPINTADFTITWTGGDGATSYLYTTAPTVASQPSTNNGVASKTAIWTTVNTDTTSYTITVTPRNNAGSPAAATATLLRTPVAPTISAYTSTGFTVTITAVAQAASYNIYLNGIKYVPTSSSSSTAFVFTGLNGGTPYNVTYTALSNTGHESRESPSTSSVTKPSAPYSFILTNITPTSFTLTWSGGDGATSYSYTITPTVAGQPSANNGVISKSANFTGLSNATAYTITVTATGANGSSEPGTATILPAPTNMIFSTASNTGFAIGIISSVPSATSYSIYINDIKYTVSAVTNGIVISNQKPGSLVNVYGRSIVNDVEGWKPTATFSKQLTATIPMDFVVSNTTSSSFNLSWSGGDGATSYRYTISPTASGQPSTDNGVASKSAVFTGLDRFTTYTVTVEAMTGAVSSGTGTVKVVGAPTLTAGNTTPTTVNITILSDIGADSYNLYIGETLYINSVANSPTIIPVTVLTRGAKLTFTAIAVSQGVGGFKSNPLVVQLPPTTPTNLILSDFSNTGFKVKWTGPSSPEATEYRYSLLDISSVPIPAHGTPVTSHTITDNGLTSQSAVFSNLDSTKSYYLRISALAETTSSGVGVRQIPAGVSLLPSYISSITQTGLTINILNPIQFATSYNLYINGSLYTSPTTTIASTTIVVTGQPSGSELTMYVRAVVFNTEIWWALEQVVRLAPSTPTNLVASAFTTTGFNLGWTGPISPEASEYTYTISDTVGQPGIIPAPADITDTGLASNTAIFWNLNSAKTYTITLQATRDALVSGIASTVIPAAAGNLSASAITMTGFVLRVGRTVPGASSYNVYINGVSINFPASSQSSTTTVSSETFTIAGRTEGELLNVSVCAIVGEREFWPSATLVVPLIPSPVTGLTPSDYNMNGFKLTWSGGNGATSYSYGITCSNSGWKTRAPSGSNDRGVTSKFAIFTELSYSNSYTITLTAVNVSGSSSAPITILNGPTNVSSSDVTATGFSLTINAAVTGATSYNIYMNSGKTYTIGSYTLFQNTTTVGSPITVDSIPAESLTKILITSKMGDIEGWPFNYFTTTYASNNGLTASTGGPVNIILDSTGNLFVPSVGDWEHNTSAGAIISKISTNRLASLFKSIDNSQNQYGYHYNIRIYPKCVDIDGNMYAIFNNRILMFDITGYFSYLTAAYTVSPTLNYSVSGGTSANATQFFLSDFYSQILLDAQRNIYVNCGSATSYSTSDLTIICKIAYSGKNSLGVPQYGNVTRFAGTGLYEASVSAGASLDAKTNFQNTFYNGDNGQATDANLRYLNAITIDSNDNIYINAWPFVIRKITPSGIITTVTGTSGYLYYGGTNTLFQNNLVPLGYTNPLAQVTDGINTNLLTQVNATLYIDSSGNTFLNMRAEGLLYKISPNNTITFLNITLLTASPHLTIDKFGNMYYSGRNPGDPIYTITPYLPVQLTVSPITLTNLQVTFPISSTTSLATSGFTLTWTATGEVTSYSYYGAGIPSTDNGVSSQTAIFTGLDSTKSYSPTVTANKWGTSASISLTFLGAPTVRTALEFNQNYGRTNFYDNTTSTSSFVSISNVTNAQSYNIYLGVPPVLYTTVITSGNVTISNQAAGSLLNITVSAVIGGQSGFPTTKQLQLKPSTITGISITYNSISELTINWSGGDGATSYIFYYTDTDGGKTGGGVITGTVPTITGKTATFTGLTSTTNYWGVLLRVNSSVIVTNHYYDPPGYEMTSNLIEFVNAPTLTSSFISSVTRTGFTLTISSYTKSSNFNVYINGTLSRNNVTSPIVITGRVAGELLNLYVRAIVGGVEIWPSNTIAVQLLPSQPINLTATFTTSTTGFSLTWTGGDGATSYSFSGLPFTPTRTNKTAVITGVVSTTSYTIIVTATNSRGSTASSSFIVPTAPTLTAGSITAKTSTGFTLTTSAVTGATSYNVYINDSLYFIPASTTTSSPTTIIITGQTPGALLNIYVRAVVGGQEIWPTNTLAVQLPPPIYTLPGTGTDAKPLQFAFDMTGNLFYISQSLNLYTIANTGTICEPTYASTSTLLGGAGGGISATFNNPTAMVFDTAGNLYVADNNAQNVLKFTNSGSASAPTFSGVSTLISTANKANIRPWALAFDAGGNLYISDTNSQQILKVSKSGENLDAATLATVVGSVGATSTSVANGDGGPALSATLYFVRSIVFDGIGNLYFTSELHKINIVYNTGTPAAPVFGNIDTLSYKPPGGTGAYIGNPTNGTTQLLGTSASTKFNKPNTAAFDKSGNLYIGDLSTVVIANNIGTASTPSYGVVNILYNSSTPVSTPLKQLGFNSAMALWFIDSTNNIFTNTSTLSPPQNITASNFTSTGFTLKWLGADKASSYTYSPAATTDNGVASKSAIFTGLTAGVSTVVTITAICGAVSSPASITIPGAPSGSGLASSAITSTGFTLTIGTPVAGATSYNVYINDSLYLIPASTTTSSPTTIIITGQTASASLSIRASAIVGGVEGWRSSPALNVQLS